MAASLSTRHLHGTRRLAAGADLCYCGHMTRTEAIAIITAALPKLDDARVAEVAELVQAAAEPDTPFRDLTDEERAGLARAKEDFAAGRTYSVAEARALSDEFLAEIRAKYPTTS